MLVFHQVMGYNLFGFHLKESPLTPNNFVIAVSTLVSITVSIPLTAVGKTNYTYWVYVPNPPLLMPVEWGEVPVHVYIYHIYI